MSNKVFVVYSYFPKREGVVLRKVFADKTEAEAYKAILPTEEDGQKCLNYSVETEYQPL